MDARPEPLSLDTVLHAKYDKEKAKLLCKNDLQTAVDAFEDDKLYPYLEKALKLSRDLEIFTKQIKWIDSQRKEMVGIDLENKQIEYELPDLEHKEVEDVLSLLDWIKPYLSEVIKDGKELQDQATESIDIDEVGIIQSYTQEGYLMLLDDRNQTLNVHPYERMIYGSGETVNHYIRLKDSVEQADFSGAMPSLEHVKENAIESHDWFPNPTTFYVESDKTLPYEHTLAPVPTKVLAAHLRSGG